MKKLLCTLALVMPIALGATINDAAAQRKNHTRSDVVPASDMAVEETAAMPQGHMQKHMDKKMGKHMDEHGYKMHKMFKRTPAEWLEKENAEINEDYQEAVARINKSSLPQDYKDLLMKQAMSNKEFAMKQAQAKSEILGQNWKARETFPQDLMKEKANRKAVKEVDDIL